VAADALVMDGSAYAFAHGVRHTRETLHQWQHSPGRVVGRWVLGAALAAAGLLAAVLLVASLDTGYARYLDLQPPFSVGGIGDVLHVLRSNLLVLALHGMACVAGFIAGSSLPLQAEQHTGFVRVLHERGKPIAIGFVMCAITFSLSWQTYALGTALAHVSASAHVSTTLLLVGLLPHALPELVALFLPLSAWMVASRRKEWDRLLAATFVTVGVAVPMLVLTGLWEVFVAPHVLTAIFGHGLKTH
jgi:hypothetical protein